MIIDMDKEGISIDCYGELIISRNECGIKLNNKTTHLTISNMTIFYGLDNPKWYMRFIVLWKCIKFIFKKEEEK